VSLAPQIKSRALELGFDACGIASAAPSDPGDYFARWIAEGKAGEMAWLARDPARRSDPGQVLPGARSLVAVGLNYWQPQPAARGRIARYALGRDYHELMDEKLAALETFLQSCGARTRRYVDTGPVLEKPHAQRAGLGWQGKSTMLLHRRLGPWLFLGEILTTLDLPADAVHADHCGSCTRCLDACPTGAITAPYQLDARRCISYLTIELKGSIPEEFRPLIGDRIYGCDECLEVCPWNRFAQTSRETQFASGPREDMADLLALTPAGFKERFRGSPIFRIKRRGLLRNVCVALGNVGTTADLPALERAAQDEEPLIREHAAWAIRQIQHRFL
jgi:epoxyqueuosine reductase